MDGDYYFDNIHLEKFTIELYNEISKNLENNKSYTFEKNGKQYSCKNISEIIYICSNEKEPTALTSLKFVNFGDKIKKHIFSIEQLKVCLKYNGFSFPLYDNILLSEEEIKELFYSEIQNDVKVTEIPLEEIYSNEIPTEIKEFKDLSKYINLYVKNKNIFEDFEEKDFLNEKDYQIDLDSKFDVYEIETKKKFWHTFDKYATFKKEYFFTGPHGIGKTFILLTYLYKKSYINNPVYFNMEALNNANNYFEIIAYESRRLFNNYQEFKSFFDLIKECKNNQTIFGVIKNIISNLSKGNYLNKKYIIILDQIKIKNNNCPEFFFIKEVRELTKNAENIFLIGCASLDYYYVKESLLAKNQNKKETTELPPFEYFSKIYSKPGFNINNNYLSVLGYWPRYIQLSSKINKKIVNVFKKKIKKKIKKFYSLNKDKNNDNVIANQIIGDLEKISMIAGKSVDGFYNYLKYFPIKFLSLDFKEYKIDYLYPLVEIAFKEFIRTLKFEHSYEFGNDQEIGWQFEHRVLDKFISTNIFFNYYIDSVIEIPTVFKKYEKLKNFNEKENTLFIVKFSNVKRYDSVIYFANEEILVLLQISVHKTKKQLEQYIQINFEDDIAKIKKNFLDVNNIKPKKYFLLFILDKEKYKKINYQNIFIEKDFQFILFDRNINDFEKTDIKNFKLTYQINVSNIINDSTFEIKPINEIIFKKKDCFEISNINEDNIYYINSHTTLEEFFDEIIDNEILKELVSKKYNMRKFHFYNKLPCDATIIKRFDEQDKNYIAFSLYERRLFMGIESGHSFKWEILKESENSIFDSVYKLDIINNICFVFKGPK